MKYLFVSPHPDDSELGAGATISRLVRHFNQVDIAVVVGASSLAMLHSGDSVPFMVRMEEQKKAADLLGVATVICMNLGDAAQLDRLPMYQIVGDLDKLMSVGRYDVIVGPLPSYHVDHRLVHEAILTATRPGRCDWASVYFYEQATDFHGLVPKYAMGAKRYTRLSEEDMLVKEKAIQCYGSQFEGRQNSIAGLSGVWGNARKRGEEIGCEFAEVMYPLREIV